MRNSPKTIRVPNQDLMRLLLEYVHPGNLGPLPPSPSMLAFKGAQMGLGVYGDFFHDVVDVEWYRRNRIRF